MCLTTILVPNSVIDIVMIITSVLWLLASEADEILYNRKIRLVDLFNNSMIMKFSCIRFSELFRYKLLNKITLSTKILN